MHERGPGRVDGRDPGQLGFGPLPARRSDISGNRTRVTSRAKRTQ